MTVEDEIISAGRDAWWRLQAHERTSWDDWKTVGRAILVLRKDAMLTARANRRLAPNITALSERPCARPACTKLARKTDTRLSSAWSKSTRSSNGERR